MLNVVPKPGNSLSVTDTLFPGLKSSLPDTKVLNITYNCVNKQLDVEVEIHSVVDVIPKVLTLENAVLSLSVLLEENPTFITAILSANTKLLALTTFVVVHYDFTTEMFDFKGVPTNTNSLSALEVVSESTASLTVKGVLEQMSGTSLPVPSVLGTLTDITFYGHHEEGKCSFAVKGKSNNNYVALIHQFSSSKSTTAIIATIKNFNLASLVSTTLQVDISGIPLFGDLQIPELGFSAATDSITSSLLPKLYETGSPLERFNDSLPKGVAAYFTADIAGVSVNGLFLLTKGVSLKIPTGASLTVKQLLSAIDPTVLKSLPKVVSNILNSQIAGFNYNPNTKQLHLAFGLSELPAIPNVLTLTTVRVVLSMKMTSKPSIDMLTLSGTWKFGAVALSTSIDYDSDKNLMKLKAAPLGSDSSLTIKALAKHVGGIEGELPSSLSSMSLSSVIGSMYNNGNYFIAISGTVTGGNIYLIFFRGTEGVKVGIAASLESFKLSDFVQSAVGIDIQSVPYFGSLKIPDIAFSMTSGEIKSPVLPHLFGSGSPLQAYGDTLPPGVTAEFSLDIGSVKGALARFYSGIIQFKIPDSTDLSIQGLATVIPDISKTFETLPSQIQHLLNARITSFSFNTTTKDIAVKASSVKLTIISGFLSLSNVAVHYRGTFDENLITTALECTGTWQIGDYSIYTTVAYDGESEELTLTSETSGEKSLSISMVMQSLIGTTIPLPKTITSFSLTAISGKATSGTIVVVMSGTIGNGNGKISAVIEKSPSDTSGAIIVDINKFKLAQLIQSATGIDISDIAFLGSLEIPELKFAAATTNITNPLLADLAIKGTALQWFKTGIVEGISGRFFTQIGDSRVAADFANHILSFKVPDTSTLSLKAIVSVIPGLDKVFATLPSQLSGVLNAQISSFAFDPVPKKLEFQGSIQNTMEIVPDFLSLSGVEISLVLVLSPEKQIEILDLSGNWLLKDLSIRTIVSYNRKEDKLDISGDLDVAKGGVTVPEIIKSLSGQDLNIPSVVSSVKLSRVSGNKIGDVVFVSLAGTVGGGQVFIIFQKSPSGSAVAFAADIPSFKFSSLVSSAVGIDISGVPFFGSLQIPRIAFSIASKYISNDLLSELFPGSSLLARFGASISKGLSATFNLNIADVRGMVADFSKGQLDIRVPKGVDLSLTKMLEQLPGLENLIDSLPQTLRDIGSTSLSQVFFIPRTNEFEVKGSLQSLTIIPELLILQDIEFEVATIIGRNTRVKFVIFRGNWVINSLTFTTEIVYEENVLLVSGSPADEASLNLKEFIKGLSKTDLAIPAALDSIKFKHVAGKVQGSTFSLVLTGEIGSKADISIVYELSKESKTVALAADVEEFRLSDLIKTGTGIDISGITYFGKLVVPSISFVISSNKFSTANLPDINATDLIPKELLLDFIPEGLTGQFSTDIGDTVGLLAKIVHNTINIEVPPSISLSLSKLLATFPEIKRTIDSLPTSVQNILNANIVKLVLKQATKDLVLSMNLDSLEIIPDVLLIQDLSVTLDACLSTTPPAIQAAINVYELVYPEDFTNEIAVDQGIKINTFQISGIWIIQDVEIEIDVAYDKQSKMLNIEGIAEGGQGVGIADIIKAFTTADVPVLPVLSSLKLTKVTATISNTVKTVIVSATAGNANVYLLYQKTPSSTAFAVAAEVQSFKIVDLIKTATGLDLTGTPFIGSFVITTMGFTSSTNPITSPLLADAFSSDSPLQAYKHMLPKGMTAHFEVEIGGKRGVAVSLKNKMLTFELPQSIGLSLSDLLSEMPSSISSAVNSLPSPMSDLSTTSLQAMQFDTTTKTLSVSATLDTLTVIPNKMVVSNIEASFVATLTSSSGALQILDFSANWVLGAVTFRVEVSYDKDTKLVTFNATSADGLSIDNLISSLTSASIPFPSALSSVRLTSILGRKSTSEATIIFSGTIADRADVHVVYQSMGSLSHVGIAAGIETFQFSELVQSAVNIDITGVPFFGEFSIPSLALSVTNSKISSDLLSEVFVGDSLLEMYGNTIPKGFTAKFNAPIGDIRSIIGSYSDKIFSFSVPSNLSPDVKMPNISSLPLRSILSAIPPLNDILSTLPSQLAAVLNAQISSFAFDPVPKKLSFTGSLPNTIEIVPDFLSLSGVEISLVLVLSPKKQIEILDLSGNWLLKDLSIRTIVSYNRRDDKLDISGDLDVAKGVTVPEIIKSLSGQDLNIPSVVSSVKLSRVSGNKIGDVVFVSLAGTVGGGKVFIIFQNSPSGSAVAFAADIPSFKFSSLVSSAVGIDISGVPFFGSLQIPRIAFSIASKYISNDLLSELFPESTLLARFRASISKGLSATFNLNIADVKGMVADFSKGQLDIRVPRGVDLSLTKMLEQLPGLENLIDSLPQTLRDIGSTNLNTVTFIPQTKRFQLKGSLESLTVIPELLKLRNIEFEFDIIFDKNTRVKYVLFKGDWVINSLALTTNIVYENNVLLVSGSPASETSLNLKEFIKTITKTHLNIPEALDTVKLTHVVGKIEGNAFSFVLMGEIGTKAHISIVYKQSKKGKAVALAADVEQFRLSDLIRTGTGIDISSITYFGKLVVPSISFAISSDMFSTANLPDIHLPGVTFPKQLQLKSLPKGLKGEFQSKIGGVAGIIAKLSDNMVTFEVPPSISLSLSNLLATFPEIKRTIDSLPTTVKDILNANIVRLVFKPATKDLVLSMKLDSLKLIPGILSIEDLSITLDACLSTNQLEIQAEIDVYELVYPEDFTNEIVVDQGIKINTFEMSGTWIIQDVEIEIDVAYDKQSKMLNIEGIAEGGQGVGIADIIKAFTTADVPVLPVLSSLKLTKVTATISNTVKTVIVSATAGNANVYLLYQKTPSSTAFAVAAEVQSFKIVDLIKTATGVDLTGTPFIGSFVITSIGFTSSTNPITSPLLADAFSSDSSLQVYRNTLPKGLTAHFEVKIGGKRGITVNLKQKMLVFELPRSIDLSLNDLLSEMPSISSVVNSLPSPMRDLSKTSLRAMQFDATTKILSVSAYLPRLTIIQNRLVVTDIQVSFVASLSSSNGALQTLKFSANWVMGAVTFTFEVSYDKSSRLVMFSATSTEGANIQQLIRSLTGSSIPFPSAINSARLTKVVGRKSASEVTIIFSGTIANKADVHVVYQSIGLSSRVGVAAGIKSFRFSELVKSAVNIDISSVPFFGRFSIPSLALSVTNSRISSHLLTSVFVQGSPLLMYGDTIPKGFTAKFEAPIGNIRGVIGSYKDKVLSFTVPPHVQASLGSLASAVGVDINSLGIGSVFGNILNIGLSSFTFDVPNKKLTVEMFFKKVTFYENILSMRDIRLKIYATFSPTRLSAEARGVITLGRTNYAVSIARDSSTNKYSLTIQTANIPISDMVTAVGASFLPDDLRTILRRVFQFNIRNAKVVYPFGAQPPQIMVSGLPEIFGWKTVRFTAVAFKYSGRIRMVQKYDFGTVNIADLIKKLIGVSLHKLKILDQSINIQFFLSPNAIRGVRFSVPEFSGLNFNQGITIKAPLSWPRDCSSDAFCNVAYKLLGGARLNLEGTIANARSFTMTASIGQLKLGGGVELLHAGLQFVGGTNPSVGIVGSLQLKNPKITLMAAIRATVGGIKLEGSMSGCWYNAFGSQYLSLCNLYLSMTIIPAPLPISGLEFGGRVEVGKKSCGHVLTAEGYVGINVLNPNENFFYADVGPVTFQKFFNAFCLRVNLPKPLGDSGFPNGFKTSFSLLGKELPHAGISIPPGYRFKGTLDILGLRAYADIYIQLPTRITAKINLPPVRIGPFRMYRSSNNKRDGPYLNADISTKKPPSIEAQGFVQVFGISVESRLLITSQKYELEVTGKFLHLFEAHLRIYAQYSKSITSGSFMVEGWFKSDLFDRISNAVRNGLKKSADEADKHISRAQNKINAEKAKFDAAWNKLENAKRKVDDAQGAFDRAIDKVNNARRKVDGICSYRSCGSGMLLYFTC